MRSPTGTVWYVQRYVDRVWVWSYSRFFWRCFLKRRARPMTQSRLKRLVRYNPATGIMYAKATGKPLGTVSGKGYLAVQLGVQVYAVHVLAWVYMYGKKAKGVVDHIDHDKTNNRRSNLRDVSQLSNSRNRSMSKSNKSGYTGVFWDDSKKGWIANIRVDGKYRNLGCYRTVEDAVKARDAGNRTHEFHVNHGKMKADG